MSNLKYKAYDGTWHAFADMDDLAQSLAGIMGDVEEAIANMSALPEVTVEDAGLYLRVGDDGVWKKDIGDRKLATIAVTTNPTKTSYVYGETFQPDGMVVTATYSDGTEGVVTGYSVTPSGALSTTDTVVVSYADGGLTKTTSVPVTISKAPGSMTLSKTSVALTESLTSDTVTVTRAGDGEISAVSNDTNVVSVSVSGNVVTIKGEGDGSTTVTISVAEGTNHFAPASQTVNVTAVDQLPPRQALNDTTWAGISNVSAAGKAANYWAVGDRKGVAINGTIGTLSVNSTYYVYILGFDHNGATNTIDFGTFKTALTGGADICLCDSKCGSISRDGTKYFNMNHRGKTTSPYSAPNYGGWKGCDARYDMLGSTNKAPFGYGSTPTTSRFGYDAEATTTTSPVSDTLMAALPADLRAVMKPMTIYTDNKGNSSNVAENVTTSVDYLPLLSEFEIFGLRRYANQYEQNQQEQYQYYKNGNSKVKNKHDDTTTAASWWGRSPYYYLAHEFFFVSRNGSVAEDESSYSLGLAPVFRV